MQQIQSIAVTGKGGTGKTVVATLLIRLLSERYPGRVLAIDADSAMSLPYTLGVQADKTVSQMRKELLGLQELKQRMSSRPTKELMREILAHGNGFDLLAMGRPEEPGCFCAVNELLRYGIETLMGDYDFCIIDGEAGPEQINRRVLKHVDILLVVSDMSARSLKTAASILAIGRSSQDGIDVRSTGLILNRVRGDIPDDKFLQEVGIEVLGSFPEDALVNSYDREGKTLFDLPADSACPAAARDMLRRLIPSF